MEDQEISNALAEVCCFSEFDIFETDEPLALANEKDLETFFGLDVPKESC